MKNIAKSIIAFGLMAGVLASCSDDVLMREGEGSVNFDVKVNAEAKVATRATDESTLAENCIIYVYNTQGLIRKYRGTSSLPEALILKSGNYRVTASAGDSVPASFTARYFKGETPFVISAGCKEEVSVECKIANSVVAVDFGNLAEGLTDYQLQVNNAAGELVFTESNADARGYFMLDVDETELQWTLTGKQLSGADFSKNGTISGVKRGYLYNIKMSYTQNVSSQGGAIFDIAIQEEEIESKKVVLTAAPKFLLNGGRNTNEPVVSEPAKFLSNVGVYCSSACALKNLHVSAADNLFTSKFGLADDEFDFFSMTESYKTALADKGVGYTYEYNADDDNAMAKITWSKDLLNTLDLGSYTITFTATDVKDKVRTYIMNIDITDAAVVTIDVIDDEVYTSRAVLYGTVLKTESTGYQFRYRAEGASEWTVVDATVDGTALSAAISGLTAGTTYEYQAICDGFNASNVKTFKTEEAKQLPNNSFEDWQTTSSPYLIYGENDAMFWDSGNHGSATMNKNVTVPSTTLFHSGSRSIDLKSQFVGLGVIGKFAAGNVFVGKYLKTDGTDGILGWGREFKSRPTQLTGYVKYSPVTIDNNSGAVEGATGMDKGQIFIALWDESTETDSSTGETWPKIIKTKSSERMLFDPNSEHIIAYGTLIFTEKTAGDGLIPFTINLEYRSNKRPSAIILTCSASMYGDYFCGGNGSEMWLDDLQLVYE